MLQSESGECKGNVWAAVLGWTKTPPARQKNLPGRGPKSRTNVHWHFPGVLILAVQRSPEFLFVQESSVIFSFFFPEPSCELPASSVYCDKELCSSATFARIAVPCWLFLNLATKLCLFGAP